MQLSNGQCRQVEELIRRKGAECAQCGSTALASNGQAYSNLAHRILVQFYCTNKDVEHTGGFGPYSQPLTDAEAWQLGLA